MLAFYLDEDCSEIALIDALIARGFVVQTPDAIGLQGREDLAQLDWSARNRFTLITHNVGDFVRLHSNFIAEGRDHYGIVLMRQQSLGIGEKLRRLIKIGSRFSPDEMKNRLEYLSNW
jgi:hypothetical protein